MSTPADITFVLGASLVAALLVTPAARALALGVGAVARPVADRWHRQPTPLLGGVAVLLATAVGVGCATMFLRDAGGIRLQTALLRPALGIAVSAGLMFVIGLVDDLVHLRPQVKFVLQLLAGVALISLGAVFHLMPWYVANVVLTLLWFVTVTNAFNLLDNMDGVAAGVGSIASFFLGIAFAQQGAWLHASVAWALTGATLGFLRYNFHPASIFMGDAGSLFLGAVMGGLMVSSPAAVSGSLVSVLFVPLTVVAVPILDTVLVTVTRTLAGRAISQGGRDHSTHRLVALGLGERQVALLLYTCAVLGGLVALFLTRLDRGLGILIGGTFLVAMCLLAAYLGRLRVGYTDESPKRKPVIVLTNLLYKRRLAEILLDAALVALAYYGAYRLRFDSLLPPAYVDTFQATLGLVIAVKVTMFGLFGVYRGAWQYVGILDLYRIVGAVAASSVLVFVYGELWFPTLAQSHSILYIDALLTAALVLASRLSFPSLEMLRKSLQLGGERVLIYGAGDGGELALRELVNNRALRMQPVCFLDDDVRKHGAQLHGVPVVGGRESLALAVDRFRVSKILIGTKKLSPDTLATVRSLVAQQGLDLAELDLGFRSVSLRTADQTLARAHASTVRPVTAARAER